MKSIVQRRMTIAVSIFILIIVRGLLHYVAQGMQSVEASPLLLVLSSAFAWLIGIGIIGLGLLLALTWLKQAWHFIASLITETLQPDEPPQAADNPLANVRDLSQAVSSLQRNGQLSREALETAEAQSQLLVDVVKRLQQTTNEMSRQIRSLNAAKEALQENDILAIKEASGAIQDNHIASLMQLASEDTDEGYWQAVKEMVAMQLGACRRWQQEYALMTARLMAEVSTIKQGLLEAEARITVSEAAQPLLTARTNVERVTHLLRPPALSPQLALEG